MTTCAHGETLPRPAAGPRWAVIGLASGGIRVPSCARSSLRLSNEVRNVCA